MTFFHFLNCIAVTFAPYFITYMYSGLAEYSSVWKCVHAGFAYFATQLVKFIALATFFPASEHEGEKFDFIAEFMKSTVDTIDILGLYLVIAYSLAGKGEVRFLAAGLGWSAADCLATRILPFWVGARGLGFDWRYIQMGLESNLNLVHFVAVAGLVWLWNRSDLQWHMRHVATGLLAYAAYRNLLNELLMNVAGITSWPLLLVKTVLTIALAASSLVIYGSLQRREMSR